MKVIVIGTGYVGLVTGACLAEVGTEVVCVDVNRTKIRNLEQGILPIYEPGLEEIVTRNAANGRLSFSTNLAAVIPGAAVAFIAVGTPPGEDGSADLQYVLQVAKEIGQSMTDYLVVVTKSTVPVGTAVKVNREIKQALQHRDTLLDYDVASNPEFLKEGAAVQDFLKPDRIVVGVNSDRSKEVLEQLYRPFLLNGRPIIFMDIASAEMTKYAANAMLATKISFINDIANLCDLVGADVNMVRKGIGSDARIGTSFIYPGIGYGGSCFPKDVKALVKTGKEYGHTLRILEAVEAVNNDQKLVLFDKIRNHYDGELAGVTFGIWGLSFKPGTDDMREAASLVLISALLEAGAIVRVFDPVAMEEAKHTLGDSVVWCEDMYHAVEGADAVALVTEWNDFRLPDWSRMKGVVVFDGRNIYDLPYLKKKGIVAYGIGTTQPNAIEVITK
ncbi:UDP-glucose dehydrogenase family protein [Chitinophaga sancti]|uniref:UDP-glucose 6-dehydrogenase n=1 Tax=Chitinophaga sancti TaxID=1004 RepID=A0A1K1QVC5_9BACT|nr:UDP-glucose/GDP-mannose dehydrogenase family protein [Chitinophaga sancti]WQD61965.1 UDP-glucose/GDP-mannose dehydrogenase family protein [Chitinophaga sancti]WQG92466.1 UDP-glucose/GDP-mannose dehydrogenase family protein [Chitinophaga sancti]SFW63636.1 UDPglucose 6-dehydrogenase [Chitinophaga sancti]